MLLLKAFFSRRTDQFTGSLHSRLHQAHFEQKQMLFCNCQYSLFIDCLFRMIMTFRLLIIRIEMKRSYSFSESRSFLKNQDRLLQEEGILRAEHPPILIVCLSVLAFTQYCKIYQLPILQTHFKALLNFFDSIVPSFLLSVHTISYILAILSYICSFFYRSTWIKNLFQALAILQCVVQVPVLVDIGILAVLVILTLWHFTKIVINYSKSKKWTVKFKHFDRKSEKMNARAKKSDREVRFSQGIHNNIPQKADQISTVEKSNNTNSNRNSLTQKPRQLGELATNFFKKREQSQQHSLIKKQISKIQRFESQDEQPTRSRSKQAPSNQENRRRQISIDCRVQQDQNLDPLQITSTLDFGGIVSQKCLNKNRKSMILVNQTEAQEDFRVQKLDLNLLPKEYHKYCNDPHGHILEIYGQILDNCPVDIHVQRHEILDKFLTELGSLYNDVPYHNITHAFDVSMTFDNFLIKYDNLLLKIFRAKNINDHCEQKLSMEVNLQRMIGLIVGYAHDSGHQGFTSSFYLNSNDDLAINHLYESPLQQMHASNLMALLRKHPHVLKVLVQPLREFMENHGSKRLDFVAFEKKTKYMMIRMILATDNSKHFELVKKISSLKNKIRTKLALCSSVNYFQQEQMQPLNADQELCLYQYILHCSDLSNCAKTINESIEWTKHLYEEFFFQSQVEIQMKLPNSFGFMNFDKMSKSQVGFIRGMVIPMFEEISFIEPDYSKILKRIEKSLESYIILQKQQEGRQN